MTITEERDVTRTATVGGVEVPAPPEGLDFRYLGADLAERFDASLAQIGADTDAALAEERTAFWAAGQRAHARLDIYQHGRASAPVAVLEPVPEPPPPAVAPDLTDRPAFVPGFQPAAPVATLPALPEAQEAAMGNFLAAHDAQDAVEGTEPEAPAEAAENAQEGSEEDSAAEAPVPVAEPAESTPETE